MYTSGQSGHPGQSGQSGGRQNVPGIYPNMPQVPGHVQQNSATTNFNHRSNQVYSTNHLQNKQPFPQPFPQQFPQPFAQPPTQPFPQPPTLMPGRAPNAVLTPVPTGKILPPPPPVRPVVDLTIPKQIDPTERKEKLVVDTQLWGSANTGIVLLFLVTLAAAVFVIPSNLRFFWVVFISLVVLELIAFLIYANVAENSSETAQVAARVLLYGQYILFCVTFVAILLVLCVKVYGILKTKTNIMSQNEVSGNEKVIEEVKRKLDDIKRKKTKFNPYS